jgi:serine protease
MKKSFLLFLGALLALTTSVWARELKPRLMFEKYLFAEGVDPKARYLDQLMVKFFDEDMVRLRDGQLTSTNGRNSLGYVQDFLTRHPEIKPEIIIDEPEDQYEARQKIIEDQSGQDLVDLFSFYRFRLTNSADDPHALLADILKAPEVEIAYYESIPAQACSDIGSVTPNLVPEQTYYNPAPNGVDYTYVKNQFTADVADGSGGTWAAIIEYSPGFNFSHEDFASPVNGTPEVTPNTTQHGVATMGIVGACKSNNVGCSGFLADESMHGYDIGALSSVAAVYNRVNSQLLAGEVTNSSWGYFSSPMPPGQSCPCNPGQNGMVPPEYDPATKAAIQAGVAAGIHYFLSAGNGCTNLDSPTFGNTFRWAAETGSCYVGAVVSTVPHNAACFTCFGERVTLNNWGENVTTTGYGYRFSGTGPNEYYTNSFNGTSSAGPLTAGCGGVLNNLWRNNNAGANISPTTLRSWLTINGTAPGTTPGNIGIMPNLFGITGPDLFPYNAAGWTYPIVPRNTNDAAYNSVVLPAALNSEPSTTYWNSAAYNSTLFATVSEYRRNYFDDVWMYWVGGTLGPNQWNWNGNYAYTVRGGRHTVRQTEDPLASVAETNEGNNSFVHQFVWNARGLASNVPLQFSAPPTRFVTGQTGSYNNCDGYSGASGFTGWWQICAVLGSTSTADYDARIHSNAVGSETGFDTYQKWSSQVGPLDFVGINNNVISGGLLASAINWNNDGGNYIVEAQSSINTGTPPRGRHLVASGQSLDANEIFDNWEFYADTANIPYVIEVEATGGTADPAISLFGPNNQYFAANERYAYQNANGAGQGELLVYTPTATGWYGVVVHKVDYNSWNQSLGFNLYIGKGVPDLTHYPLSGWTDQVVVRQSIGGVPAVVPATLTGNTGTNYFNASYINAGFATSPVSTVRDRFYVDVNTPYTTGFWSSWAPNATTYWGNQGPVFVFGGRHEVSDSIDVFQALTEWREDNNRYDAQYVWTPYPMTDYSSYQTTSPPPNYRDFNSPVFLSYYNQDGWRFTGSAQWSGVGGCATAVGEDDNDLLLFNPSTDSQNGFDVWLEPSWSGGDGETEFIVENGNTFGATTFDAGMLNNWGFPYRPSVNPYYMQQCNSLQDLTVGITNGPFTIPASYLVHVFDLDLTAGVPVRIYLDNGSTGDLGLALIDAAASYGSRSDYAALANSNGAGGGEVIEYTPTSSGRHGVVVFKNGAGEALTACTYRLIIGNPAPAAPTGLVMRVIDGQSDPKQLRIYWNPVTQDAAGAPITPDYYQPYYTLVDTNDVWPTDWSPYFTTTDDSIDVYVGASIPYFRMLVVAVDNDGMLIASPALPVGASESNLKAPPRNANIPAVITDRRTTGAPQRQ